MRARFVALSDGVDWRGGSLDAYRNVESYDVALDHARELLPRVEREAAAMRRRTTGIAVEVWWPWTISLRTGRRDYALRAIVTADGVSETSPDTRWLSA